MKLIRELVEDVQYIKEVKEGKETLFLKGPFAQGEVGNRNKRFYPMPTLEREVNRYVTENISRNIAFGELGHPPGPNINLDRACILVKEMNRDGNNFLGKAQVTSTPMGDIVRGLISDGARLGVSTRALGSLKLNKNGLNEVQDDLRLLAIDVVADPSGPDCWTDAIMEGSSWIYDAGKGSWIEYVDHARADMKKMTFEQVENQKLRLFTEFLDRLSTSKS